MSSNIIQGETPLKKPAVWNKEPLPHVGHIIAVASGKGGVGKSTTTVNIARALQQKNLRVGILDADIYGPSIPQMMALSGKPEFADGKMIPLASDNIKCMSIGFIMGDEAAILRGPMITKALNQLLRMTLWGTEQEKLDILLIDMPPGTGDIHLSMAQQAPINGAIIITTPQEISVIDARKCATMFQKVHIPILGVVENMSGSVFGKGGGEKLASELNTPLLGTIALDEKICTAMDEGKTYVPDEYNTIGEQLIKT